MEEVKNKWNRDFLLGENDGKGVYLRVPSFDCGWYWGFGYLGNNNCHYHLSGLMKDKDLYDGLKEHFGNTLTIKEESLWLFCELVTTAYALKETAEVLGRGGSHYTDNPLKNLIQNKKEVERINKVLLPSIFNEIYNILKEVEEE